MDEEQLETAYLEIYNDTKSNADEAAGNVPVSVIKDKLSGASGQWEDEGGHRTVKVQFNPSTLSFSANDGSVANRKKVSLTQSRQERVETAPADNSDSSIRISFKLVFDRSVYENPDVQPDVERFLSLAKDPFVRKAAFWWGKMSYKGVIKNVEAEYVLFNEHGTPTRAIVSMTLGDI